MAEFILELGIFPNEIPQWILETLNAIEGIEGINSVSIREGGYMCINLPGGYYTIVEKKGETYQLGGMVRNLGEVRKTTSFEEVVDFLGASIKVYALMGIKGFFSDQEWLEVKIPGEGIISAVLNRWS
ncbi:hypothetical protein K0B04_01100 [Patescibacteria group bacterium]|nr:hypothetical protein [Patescibacteria group bacterium]